MNYAGIQTAMLIHCTKKLASRLPGVSPQPLADDHPLGSWHAHHYTIDHRNCVLFCHDTTRFTLFEGERLPMARPGGAGPVAQLVDRVPQVYTRGAGAPRSMPSVLRSSSSCGQWMP